MKKVYILFLFLLFLPTIIQAQLHKDGEVQADSCYKSNPFCTGTSYEFPASTNVGEAEEGPDYGCLDSQPNSAWYHMRIANSGNIKIKIYTQPPKDVDFICWGPFDDPYEPCQGSLTNDMEVDCSYSSSAEEYCEIPSSAQTGEYYILLITNFSNKECNILFEKVEGEGTTDCGILPGQIIGNAPVCWGDTLTLSANTISGATFTWEGPNGFSSTEQNIVIPNVTEENAGEYSLVVHLNGEDSDTTTYNVVVNSLPEIEAGEDESIPYGTNTQLNGVILNGEVSAHHVRWLPADKVDNDSILSPNTVNLEESVEYTLAVTQKITGCKKEDNKVVTITGGALGTEIVVDNQEVCLGDQIQLRAQTSGGSGDYTYSWTSEPEGFTSDIYNPYIEPSETTKYKVEINDGYNTVNAEILITVNPLPVANAGDDFSIPHGTSTQLNASASNGTGDYMYKWLDDTFLNSDNIPNPTTKNIYDPMEFKLEVTDSKGCKSHIDNVFVSLTGTALFTNVEVSPPQICLGDTCVLKALPSGGSENYSYTWKRGEDIIAQSQDLIVTPALTTIYTLIVDDGYNTVNKEVKVVVNPLPYINLIPEGTSFLGTDTIEACATDTLLLRATQPNPSSYYWGNGIIDSVKRVYSSGLTFSMQTYGVEVINSKGCVNNAQVTIAFTYNACDNIIEINPDNIFIYPIPTKDNLYVKLGAEFKNDILFEINDVGGNLIYQSTYKKEIYKDTAIKINLKSFAIGTYLITISDGEVKASRKIIVK